MKIRIIKPILVEIEKPRINEVWDHYYEKWDELNIESINIIGKFACLTTYDGDIIRLIPKDAFEIVK